MTYILGYSEHADLYGTYTHSVKPLIARSLNVEDLVYHFYKIHVAASGHEHTAVNIMDNLLLGDILYYTIIIHVKLPQFTMYLLNSVII